MDAPLTLRQRAWAAWGTELNLVALDAAPGVLAGQVRGRTVVAVRR